MKILTTNTKYAVPVYNCPNIFWGKPLHRMCATALCLYVLSCLVLSACLPCPSHVSTAIGGLTWAERKPMRPTKHAMLVASS